LNRKLLEWLLVSPALLATTGGGGRRLRAKPPNVSLEGPGGPRILVVDSHSLVGAAVGGLLSGPPLDAAVETVLDAGSAITRLEAADFDLVVCEFPEPPSMATELVSRFAVSGRHVPVVFIAEAKGEQPAPESLTSGAHGFFMTDCPPDEFITGVRLVLRDSSSVGANLKPTVLKPEEGGISTAAPDNPRRRPGRARK
jgi:DNA-binding NarL/FixJ family response regulator